jgi:hypothetical protein
MSGTTEPRIIGSYRLEEQVGKGGMGEVYRARHTRLDTERAVKLLPPGLAAEPDFLKRFEREAAAAARLEHPNILPVYEYGEAAGAPYLVMPYVRGGTLKERLAKGHLAVGELLNLLGQAAEALDYAHEQGIVHRDVKPANLLLDGRGRLYLADFGIAKALEGAEGLTRTGVGVGTPEYMAPEQAQGRADARSDLYALGVILYQMLTGRVPYTGSSTVEVLMKHLQDPLPLLPLRSVAPAVPPRVEAVVTKALAKNPNERYASGKAMVDDLREAFASTPAGADAATVIGAVAPYPGGATAPGPGTPPPHHTGPTATVVGGAAFAATAGGTPPPPVVTPPPYGGAQGGFGQPGGPGGPGAGGGYPGTPPPQGNFAGGPPPPPSGGYGGGNQGGGGSPRRNNRNLILGLLGGASLIALLCVGLGVYALSRLGGSPTPTIGAAGQPTTTTIAVVNVGATQTAGAASANPTLTAVAVNAKNAEPTLTAVAVNAKNAEPTLTAVAANASARPSASPSASPSPSPGAAPTVAPTAAPTAPFFPNTGPSSAPAPTATTRPSTQPSAQPSTQPSATARPSTAPSTSPRPSTAPSAGPSAGPSSRPSTSPSGQLPLGNAPAGWKSYRGNAKVPFSMYYPPDWTVDESRAGEGRVYFYAPGVDKAYDDGTWVLIATTGVANPSGNVDVLRDQYFNNEIKKDHPEAGINITRNNQFSNITFASLGTNFNSNNDLCFAYIGLGLNKGVPWRFRLNSLDDDYDANLATYFNDMIGSLNIYGNP